MKRDLLVVIAQVFACSLGHRRADGDQRQMGNGKDLFADGKRHHGSGCLEKITERTLHHHLGGGSRAPEAIRPTIPERVDVLIFTITRRIKAFTVFVLMAKRFAISLVVKP